MTRIKLRYVDYFTDRNGYALLFSATARVSYHAARDARVSGIHAGL
jgi:hypothetical protein